jgi:PAS domain S-box-containing protein
MNNQLKTTMDKKYLRQWLLTIGILLLLGMVTVYDIYMDRHDTESVEQDRLLVQARVIDENLNHQLVTTYDTLQRIVGDLQYWRVGKSFKPTANIMLKTIETAMPGVRTLLILDAKGIARASSRPELIGLDFSQREYYQAVRRHPDPIALYLSPPYTTVLNVYAMPLSCLIPGPKGEFNGVIVAALDPEYFRTLLASVLYAPDMWVAVAHGDGMQFLMVPEREGQSGKNLVHPGSFFSRHRESGSDENIVSGTVYATKEQRVMAIRTIRPAGAHLNKPLVAAVGRKIGAVFAPWRRTAMIYGSVYFGIVLVTIFSLRYNQTSVRRAEAERFASEIKFREIFNKSIDAIGVSRLGIHEFVNPAFAALFGYASDAELVGKPVLELIAPGERATIQNRILRRAQGEVVPTVYETRGQRKDGTEFVMDVHASTYELLGVTYTLVITRDITERRQAEEQLQKQAAILHLTPAAIMTRDKENRITYWNREAQKLYGWSNAEALGNISHSFLQTEFPKAIAQIEAEVHREEIWEGELIHRKRDGTRVTVASRWALQRDAEGTPAGFLEINIDITERKRAEEALKQSEKKLRDITASLGEGLYVINVNGEVIFMNPEAEILLGWTEAELKGRNVHDVVHNRMPDGSPLPFDECRMHNVIKMGSRFSSYDEMFIRKDGTSLPVSVISAPLMENGGITASVTAFQDISSIKRAEQEREKLIAELQKALTEIKTLHGILPICSNCKKIRDDKGSWRQLEEYISEHTDSKFSHGLCSDCAQKFYPKYFKKDS